MSEPAPQPEDPPVEAAHGFRAGLVALCGRPNVGKSTLLNALVGCELAVATRLPQTTRERMLGVWSTDDFQAVLVDTPGIHRARSALNNYMVQEAIRGASGVDLVLLLAEIPMLGDDARAWSPGEGARGALTVLEQLGRPIGLVLTKVDRIGDRRRLLPVIDRWATLHEFAFVIPVSAVTGEGLDALQAEVVARLPEGPPLFDPDQLSERPTRWHAGERVRAAIFAEVGQELPYSCAVTIESYKERERPPRDIIHATVHVERDSQKKILVGKGGATIKAISMRAREDIARFTGRRCDLFLTVRVTRNWTRDETLLARLGYHEPIGGET
ncbi:MAG: GTPase Era [Myxococcales bacterium]|nr:GTPase Era [Myxococcales bacterium]